MGFCRVLCHAQQQCSTAWSLAPQVQYTSAKLALQLQVCFLLVAALRLASCEFADGMQKTYSSATSGMQRAARSTWRAYVEVFCCGVIGITDSWL